MTNLFDKVKAVCALVVMGLGLAAYSAAPTVTSVTAQQRYPWNGLVDIVVTFNGAESDVAKANCTFAATNSAAKTALPVCISPATGMIPVPATSGRGVLFGIPLPMLAERGLMMLS